MDPLATGGVKREDLQDGGGVRCGDHLPLQKYIKNTSTCGTTPTEHLLNAGRDLRLPKSHVADRVLVLWLAVRPEPLRWESQIQDIGPPETSRPHVISIDERSPRDLHLNAKTQLHSTTSKLQCWTPHANNYQDRNTIPLISREAA